MALPPKKIEKTDWLNQIELLIKTRQFRQAQKLLDLHKKRTHTKAERLRLSFCFLHLDSSDWAFKILGPELNEVELKNEADTEDFSLQLRLAYMHSYFGAFRSAYRLMLKLQKYFNGNYGMSLGQKADYFRYWGVFYLRNYYYSGALENYQTAADLYDPNSEAYEWLLCRISIADCLEALGKSQQAIKIVSDLLTHPQVLSSGILPIMHAALGEYWLRFGNIQEARFFLEKAYLGLAKDEHNKDLGHLFKWQGVLEMLQEKKEHAYEKWNLAEEIYRKKNWLLPNARLDLYFLRINYDSRLRLKSPWRLVGSFPQPNPFRNRVYRQIEPISTHQEVWKPQLHFWFAKNKRQELPLRNSKDGCWFGLDDDYQIIPYQEALKNENAHNTLDLVAGMTRFYTQDKKKTTPEWTHLSDLHQMALFYLWGAGEIGLNIWLLSDLLYPHDQSFVASLYLRIEDLLKQLKKRGWLIQREKHFLKLEINSSIRVISPLNYHFMGLEHYSRVSLPPLFTRRNLEFQLQISQGIANATLKNWLSKNLIAIQGSGRNINYRFC